MALILLIHGASTGGWCWEEVAPLLRSRGHVVHAPDMPGMGGDRTAFADDVFSQWVEAARAFVGAHGRSTMLVGHSLGGAVISALAERVPDRIALAVFLAGQLLADGESVMEAGALNEALGSRVVPNAAGTGVTVPPDALREMVYNGVEPDVADRAIARMVEQPLQPALVPLHLTSERFGRVRKAYIETENDLTILIDAQRRMQENWHCEEIKTLPSGHSPFYQMPIILTDVLDQLASKYVA